MTTIEHKILLSHRYEAEHKLVLEEAERIALAGGRFKIENRYSDNWYSIITIYYQEKK